MQRDDQQQSTADSGVKDDRRQRLGVDELVAACTAIATLLSTLAVGLYVVGVFYWEAVLGSFRANSGLMSLDFHEVVLLGGIALYTSMAEGMARGDLWLALLGGVLYFGGLLLVGHLMFVIGRRRRPKQQAAVDSRLRRLANSLSLSIGEYAAKFDLDKLGRELLKLLAVTLMVVVVVIVLAVAFIPLFWVATASANRDLIASGLMIEEQGKVKKKPEGPSNIQLGLSDGTSVSGRLLTSTKFGYAIVELGREEATVVNAQAIKSVIRVAPPKQTPK